jgi:nicotinate-nucleotide--dimethylbenzimidazole phosphoribosyltransferase
MPSRLDALVGEKIAGKTKPLGSLGALEDLAARVCRVQATATPALTSPAIIVFAADHGLAREGVSAYPREVTAQMAFNVAAGGAAINAFSRQHGIEVVLVDAGVDWPGPASRPAGMVDRWIGPGTANSAEGEAMTAAQLARCLAAGASAVDELAPPDCTVLGFGELGIGNTSAASLLVSALTRIPLADCVGPGTGLAGAGLRRKLATLQRVQQTHARVWDLAPDAGPTLALSALQSFGGFEIAQMVGAMRRARETGRLVLVDGFVATSALLAARCLDSSVMDSAVFCHESGEPGHALALAYLGVKPLVRLGMRLGEGTGCAVAYPIIASAVAFLNEMASFADAGVSRGGAP